MRRAADNFEAYFVAKAKEEHPDWEALGVDAGWLEAEGRRLHSVEQGARRQHFPQKGCRKPRRTLAFALTSGTDTGTGGGALGGGAWGGEDGLAVEEQGDCRLALDDSAPPGRGGELSD